jgi:hypothetical protein
MNTWKLFFSLWVLVALSCGAPDHSTGESAIEPIGNVSEALGETTCTTLQAPPDGTTAPNIGNYSIATNNCAPGGTWWSPSYAYTSYACPKQYVLQFNNTTPPSFGSSRWVTLTPQWGGKPQWQMTKAECESSHLSMTVWKESLYPSPNWIVPPTIVMRSHGVQEGSDFCWFFRDDNDTKDLTFWLELSPYQDVFRVALQAITGTQTHSVALTVAVPSCVR